MRKEIFRMPDADARAMLSAAAELTMAAIGDEGEPMLRVVNAVVIDDAIYFHGAPAGEKMESLGKKAVFSTSRVVARIPSYFVDPVLACPATTLYESVQAHGVLSREGDPELKARALGALLAKLQPEGGHEPMSADNPTYRKAVAGLLVVKMQIDVIDGKRKVGQNRTPEERATICDHLFARGDGGDLDAIEVILAHNPGTPIPSSLAAKDGARFIAKLPESRYGEALALLRTGAYWLEKHDDASVSAAFAAPSIMVGAIDRESRLIAVARILGDARHAWIFDVIVDARLRGTGLGHALMSFVLAHPAVKKTKMVRLTTRDKDAFYRKHGFASLAEAPRHTWTSIEMIRHQPTA